MLVSLFIVQIWVNQFVTIWRTLGYSVSAHLPIFKVKSLSKSRVRESLARFRINPVLFACKYALSHLLLFHFDEPVPPLLVDVQELKSIAENLLLDFVV